MWLEPWLLISTVSQLFLAVLGAVMSLHEELAKRYRGVLLSLFVALGILSVYATIQQSSKSAGETAAANAKFEQSLENIDKSTQEITRLTGLNTTLQEQLLISNKTITNLAQQSIDTTTGGDSFCYLSINNHYPYVVAVHQGKYPLYGIVARVVDLTKVNNSKLTRGEKERIIMGTTVFIGDLTAKSASMKSERFPFSDSGSQDFNIFFSARSGFWDQSLRWRLVDGKWVSALKVERYKDGNRERDLLLERIDKNFPRNEKGEVDWN
jgi:hypothetical protein